MIQDERHLIKSLQSLETTAWDTVYRELSPLLLTDIQIGFSCGLERAEEIVQQTWVRAIRSIRRFDPVRGQFNTWLKSICRNEARRLLGQTYRQPPLSQIDPEIIEALEQIDDAPLPCHILEKQELCGFVTTIVSELKPHQRSVLIKKYMEEQTVAQIAASNGQNPKATESLLTRARQAFKAAFLRKIRTVPTTRGGDYHVNESSA